MFLDLVLYTLLLWVAFIVITKVVDDNDHKWSDLTSTEKGFVVIFIVGDVAYNFTYGTILFVEQPSWKRKTLTARLKNILARSDAEFLDEYWRKPLASFMCKYMIEPWDFGHCAFRK